MKIKSELLSFFHLDKTYSLLNGKHVKILLDIFKFLDIHGTHELNDVQFMCFMQAITDLTESQIYKVFDMFDVDGSGEIDFDEFYLLMCIMIAIRDKDEQKFIYRHSKTVFDLLDVDGSNTITSKEFLNFGFLFNMQGSAITKTFHEYDVSGDQELDYQEFRMFTMACIDRQNEYEEQRRQRRSKKMQKVRAKLEKKAKKEALANAKRFGGKVAPMSEEMEDKDEDLHVTLPKVQVQEEDFDEEGNEYFRSNRFCTFM